MTMDPLRLFHFQNFTEYFSCLLLSVFIVPPASQDSKLSVDILLAYHRDAHRAASGVWYFGTQSVSCGAGTVGLENLRSAWGSRQCCITDTHSLPPGSPGHHWRVWGKKNGTTTEAYQKVCSSGV